jgi:hypothetical protein
MGASGGDLWRGDNAVVCERSAGSQSGADGGHRDLDESFADRWGQHLRPVFCWANRRGQDLQPRVDRRWDPERHEYRCNTHTHTNPYGDIYTNGDTDYNTNSDSYCDCNTNSYSYTNLYRDSYTNGDTDCNTNGHCNTNSYSYTNLYCDSYTNGVTNCNTNSDSYCGYNSNSNCDCNSYTYRDSYTNGDTNSNSNSYTYINSPCWSSSSLQF